MMVHACQEIGTGPEAASTMILLIFAGGATASANRRNVSAR